MAGEEKRFIDQVTDTALSAGDYIMVDSSSEGTRKFDLGTKLAAIDTAITAEATAREAADSQLKEDLFDTNTAVFEQGNFVLASGALQNSSNRCRTERFPLPQGTSFTIVPNGMDYNFAIYKADGTYSAYKNAWTGDNATATFKYDYDAEIIVQVRLSTNVDITPSDVTTVVTYEVSRLDTIDSEIAPLIQNLENIEETLINSSDIDTQAKFEQGYINGNGNLIDSNYHVRTADLITEDGDYFISTGGQLVYMFRYQKDGTFVGGASPWGKSTDFVLSVDSNYAYKLYTKISDSDVLTPSTNKLVIYRKTKIKETADSLYYDNAELSLPFYYKDNVENGIARYKRLKNNIIGDSFCFLTDVHLNANSMHSGAILRYIGRNTDCRKVFCGGDISMAYNANASVDFLKDYVEQWLANMRRFKGDMDYYGMRGNHDMYVYTSSALDTIYKLPYAGAYAVTCGTNAPVTKDGGYGTMYYAVDNVKEKIRYICCDTSDTSDTREDCQERMRVTSSQLQWLADTLLEVEDGWSIIVLGHVPSSTELFSFPQGYQSAIDELGALGDILRDYKNKRSTNTYGDFSNANGELVAYICGHAHTDYSVVDDNLLFIQVTCDSRSQIADRSEYEWTRTKGTVSEQAIDIFTVDTLNKKLYATRFGAGGYDDVTNSITSEAEVFDREWSY